MGGEFNTTWGISEVPQITTICLCVSPNLVIKNGHGVFSLKDIPVASLLQDYRKGPFQRGTNLKVLFFKKLYTVINMKDLLEY